MESAVKPPAEAELHLLTDWTEPGGRARMGRSAVLSLVVHTVAILFVLFMPETFMQPARPKEKNALLVTPLIAPLRLTQTAPNHGKVIPEIRTSDLSPRIKGPAGPSSEPERAAQRKPTPAPPPPPRMPPPLPEPPKVEIAVNENPKLTLPVQQQPQRPPRPRNQPDFEDIAPVTPVPPGQGPPGLQGPSVEGAIRGALAGRGSNAQQGTAQLPSSGADLPQLLSDPKGVDWAPYLAQVRAQVKRYWDSIAPNLPSVKAGVRGYVSVQFKIMRDGTVSKVVYVTQASDNSMNQAVIAAISGGSPFGPLPSRYTENEIRVQMNFAYNVPRY